MLCDVNNPQRIVCTKGEFCVKVDNSQPKKETITKLSVKVGDIVKVIDDSYSLECDLTKTHCDFKSNYSIGLEYNKQFQVIACGGQYPTQWRNYSPRQAANNVLVCEVGRSTRIISTTDKFLKVVTPYSK
jgi:hypothetical protein